jgi:hypothetical protein
VTRQAQRPAAEPTIRELTVQLSGQLARLVRSELALARAETFATARRAVLGGMMLSGAAVAGACGGLVLTAAVIAAIAIGLPLWAAVLVTGAALLACAGGLALLGARRLARATAPLRMTAGSIRAELAMIAAALRKSS